MERKYFLILWCAILFSLFQRRQNVRLLWINLIAAYVLLKASTAARHAPVPRSREFWDNYVPLLDDNRFVRAFRVPKSVFNRIVIAASSHPRMQPTANNRQRFLPVSLQVGIALWRMGRPVTVMDAANQFGVAEGSVVNCTDRVIDVLIDVFSSEITRHFPRTAAQLRQAAASFEAVAHLQNCILALDGTLLPIWKPDLSFGDLYFCRKGFYALNFQLAVDTCGRIAWLAGGIPGSAWDGTALGNTSFFDVMRLVPLPYYIIADSGYTAQSQLLVPFRRPKNGDLSGKQTRFNYLHSLTRGVVEKAIGRLKAKFRWMLKGVELSDVKTYVRHFTACAILHNMCIGDVDEPVLVEDDAEDLERPGLSADHPTIGEAIDVYHGLKPKRSECENI